MGTTRLSDNTKARDLGRRWFTAWINRRGPTRPPMTLHYRQIFILPTRFGWLLGALMFAMLMGSLNFNNNLGLLTTFIVAGLASNSMLLAYRNLNHLRILHTGAAPVHAGQDAQLQVTLACNAERSRDGLEVSVGKQEKILCIDRNETGSVHLPIATHHRGWLSPGRCRVQTCQPIGLFRAWSWFWPEDPILVWPRPASHPPPLPDFSADIDGQNEQSASEGEEFFSLRDYREGDPMHRIAWKASQRHETLLSREFRQARSRDLVFNLARAPGSDLEDRISILTAWMLQAYRQRRPWTLQIGSETIESARSEPHLQRCLRALAEY